MEVLTSKGVLFAQALARRGALKLEIAGLKRRGRPASTIVREVLKSRTRGKVVLLAEYEAWIEREFGVKLTKEAR